MLDSAPVEISWAEAALVCHVLAVTDQPLAGINHPEVYDGALQTLGGATVGFPYQIVEKR